MSSQDSQQSKGNVAGSPGAAEQSVSAVSHPQGKFDVDQNGQATYRIPIEVPPGINGSQPQLGLTYSHRQANGLLGVGWSLSGLSSITRTRATYVVDGFNGAISYNDNDRYSIDGQRLINVEGEYGQPGTLYYTEIQTWNHIRAAQPPDAGFTVVRKNGEVWKYGTTADSRILAAGGTAVRLWALSSTTDLNGNSVQYSYTQSPLLLDGSRGTADEGAYYIDRISYTAHEGTNANRFVQFVYESRQDIITDYIGGYPVITSYRLKQVNTFLAGDTPVRSYEMGYRLSTATQLSRLETVTESGTGSAGAIALPPTRMVWQDVDEPGFEIGPQSLLNQHLKPLGIQQLDVSGSGRTDIVQLWFDENGEVNASTYLATPGPDGPTFVYTTNSNLGSFPQTLKIYAADVNGDGLTDLLFAYKGSNGNLNLAVFLSNGTGFDPASANPFDTGDPWYDKQHLEFFAMDVNGDGRTDFVEAYSHYDPNQGDLLYFRAYLSKFGDGPNQMFTDAITTATEDSARPPKVLAFWAMDVNGDGMMDVVRVSERGSDSHVIATAYVSVSTGINDVSFTDQVVSDLGTISLANTKAFLPVDVNGNSSQDLLQVWQEQTSSGTTLHLTTFLCNEAGGFVAGPDTAFLDSTLGDFYPMGLNGGGLTALVNKWISGSDELMFTVYLASPSGKFREGATINAGTAGSAVKSAKFYPGDANGDGKADLIRMSYDQNQQVLLLPYLSSGPYPDLVNNITNSLGGVVTIKYLPLSDSSVYNEAGADQSSFPKGAGRRYPNPLTPTQFPVQAVLGQATYVVSGYSQSDDSSINRFAIDSAYTMTYGDARLDMLGRGWEGFRTVSKLDLKSGRITIQSYNQDFPFTGTLDLTRIEADGGHTTDPRVPKDQKAMLMSIASSKYEQFTRAEGTTGLKTPVVEVLKTASRLERYDYGEAHFDYALAQIYGYDDYGNQVLHTQLGYTDDSSGHPLYPDNPLYPGKPLYPSEVVYRYNLYQNDLFPDGWALGYLLYAKMSSNGIDQDIKQFLPGDYRLTRRTYTASTYNLASDGRWDDVHSKYLTTSYEYDSFGNRITETSPGGSVTRYDYEPDYNTFRMRMTSPEDEQGASLMVVYGYDPRYGVEVARRGPDPYTRITGLDAFGRTVIRQGPVPNIPGAESDPNALTPLVTGTPELREGFLAAAVVTLEKTAYLNDGQKGLYRETQSLQTFPTDATRDFTWNQSYVDGLGRERETVTQSGQSAGNILILTNYDADGKPVLKSLPFFSTTSIVSQAPHSTLYSYDVLERPRKQQVPAGSDGSEFSTTTWEYGTGGLVTMTAAAGSDAEYVQVYEHHYYDGEDKVRQMVVPADSNATTTYDYDPIARLLKATDPATSTSPHGVSNSITYDSLDRRLTIDNPDQNTTNDPNVKAMRYEYDPATGLLQNQTDAAGQVTSFDYDKLERVKTKYLGDGRVFHYTYDDPASNGQGRLTQVKVETSDKIAESQYDFIYDKYGNISQTTLTVAGEAAPFITSSVFDPQSRMVAQTMPDGTGLIREFSFGQLVGQTLDGARAIYPLEQYGAFGKAGKLIYGPGVLPGAGVVTDYTFNPAGQLYAEVVSGSGGQAVNLTYTYDLLTQLRGIFDELGQGNNQLFTYLNKRLKTAAMPGFESAAYDYDASGNLTTKEGVSYTYQAHFPLTGTRSSNVVYSATPDACGRTRTRNADGVELTFDYDGLGCLRRVSKAGEMLREILSDYLGRRLRQTDEDGTQVLYVSPSYQVTRPAQGSPSVTKYLLDDRGVVASIKTGSDKSILYFRLDHKGSITDTFGPEGAVASRVAYSGYGQMKMVGGPDDFRPKYEHREWDAVVGLYYFGARYYDPATGRFLTPDTQLGGDIYLQADVLNRYAFELNNPINFSDLTGHKADWVGGLVIGLVILGAGIVIVASGGTATPLVAFAASVAGGALIAGGAGATAYSLSHTQGDDFSWKDYGITLGINAAVGAVSGALFFGLSPLVSAAASRITVLGTTGGRMAATAIGSGLISGAADVTSQALVNKAEGQDVNEGLGTAALFGFVFGTAGGAIGAKFGQAAERAGEEAQPLRLLNRARTIYTNRLLNSDDVVADMSQIRKELQVTALKNLRKAVLVQSLFSNITAIPEEFVEDELG